MLKEYETNAYEILVNSGFLLDPPISMRLGFKSRNLQRLRKRNEIEVKICLALFPLQEVKVYYNYNSKG